MRVLAVDTTSAYGSIALLRGRLLEGARGLALPRPRHAERLLPAIDSLLGELELGAGDLDGLAVAIGPGSFTGLRIGIATVEGLALSAGLPAVGVSSLEAAAFRYRHRDGILVAMLEAYRDEVYAQGFRSDGITVRPVIEPVCEPPGDFLGRLSEPPALVAGTGAERYRSLVLDRFPRALLGEASFFAAEEIARLGAARIAAGERAELGGLDALYVRPSEAERNRLRRREKEKEAAST